MSFGEDNFDYEDDFLQDMEDTQMRKEKAAFNQFPPLIRQQLQVTVYLQKIILFKTYFHTYHSLILVTFFHLPHF